ncbi:unnamed protein product [Orchesella dallaii]|uniref:BTB domain-containing protein n=1 Tax=Orchesella dallaii TaxID=48710 RepID=A0ABP1QM16_9HEXA
MKLNPFKVELSGLFFTNVLKGYTEPMRIKLEFLLENQKFNIVSKELTLPIASTDEIHYRFEDKLFLSWETNSSFHSYSPFILTLNGTMTIQLLSRDTPVPSFPDATWTNKKILHDKIRCDFALRAENGKAIPCHTSMLACHSQVFERMFETDCKEVQEKTCQMHITEGAVNALLKFLYYSDLDDATKSSSISLELLKIAHEYDIGSLEIAMKNTLLDKKNVWFDWDVVLLLFQFAFKVEGYQDLKEKAVAVMKSKSGMLRGSSVFDDIFKNDLVTAKELFLHVLNK